MAVCCGLEGMLGFHGYMGRCIKFISILALFNLVFFTYVAPVYGECYSFEDSEGSGWNKECFGPQWEWDSTNGHWSNHSMKSAELGATTVGLWSSGICRDVKGPAEIAFWWKLNTTPPDSGKLQFLVDNSVKATISQNSCWTERPPYSIQDNKTHKVEWRFVMDSQLDRGSGWIDDVCIIPKIVPLITEIMPECIVNVPHFSICQNTELTDQIFLDNGVRCSEGCEYDLDYSLVDTSVPGEYTYTVICGSNEAVSIVTVVAPCEVNASDFSICQGTELSDQMFLDNGVRCSEDCELVLDYSGVNSSEPGNYAYSAKGMNGICPDTVAEGIITVFGPRPEFNETTYVDPANYDPDNYRYTSIRDAIQHVEDNGTVYVFGGIYNEHVIIDKPLKLIGWDKDRTIIHPDESKHIIYISSDNVTVQGLVIKNGDVGIYLIGCTNCFIYQNNMSNFVDSGMLITRV